MLKIKFTRIKNLVIMEVLEQGPEIRRGQGLIKESFNGIKINSSNYPQLTEDTIYVLGELDHKDSFASVREFKSIELASRFYSKCIDAVERYNEGTSTSTEVNKIYADEEIYITGEKKDA